MLTMQAISSLVSILKRRIPILQQILSAISTLANSELKTKVLLHPTRIIPMLGGTAHKRFLALFIGSSVYEFSNKSHHSACL
jgi:hypothetical protein